ncbi:hypothetical protein NGM33_28465 [Nocardiopsis dassonvillei]|uniref:hypothetical protein n=1 Tax=Nocardiopsis dassonvillei TaxID=2014 RepID=UPI0020A5C8F3|nr:hypothetical protein [Nocardiopsis dassonvillei]MCP3017270.1 hypothetical protein [Nocardiopsis dassonvillei]
MSTAARIVGAPDHPSYEDLVELTLDQRAALPARFHTPWFDADGQPNSWLCAVCWDEGTVTQWPCKTAQENGREVFDRP